MSNENAYSTEWSETIEKIRDAHIHLSSMKYFIDLGMEQGNEEYIKTLRPKVILLGLNYPAEILNAVQGEPVYLLGGSFVASGWSESIVPRDTDSAIKSILGVLLNEDWNLAKEALVLIPITCDSMRKLSNMLQESLNVLPIEIPSCQNNELQKKHWKDEVRRVLTVMEKHLGKRISRRELQRHCRHTARARMAWQKLNEAYLDNRLALNGSARMYLSNTYFWAKDIDEWADNILALIDEAKHEASKEQDKSSILLIGSPIYAPNYKIPFLFEELNINVKGSVHPAEALLSATRMDCSMCQTMGSLLDGLADDILCHDMSPAFTENRTMFEYAKGLLEAHRFDGVVFHILKGQIEYDFELSKMDDYLTNMNLPIFRLETDYNYQDIEQLRIRIEAFGEMLDHRREVQASDNKVA